MQLADLQADFKKLPPLTPRTQWDQHRLALREVVASRRASRFLKSDVIHATMFVGQAPYIELELDELLRDEPGRWRIPLSETTVGDPPRLSYAEWTSGNRVHQCYHLKQFIDRTRIHPSDLHSIFEFGGGYGVLCHIFHRMRFKGMYYLYDLPEFMLLQRFYLEEHTIEADFVTKPPMPNATNLFVALFSFSEIPIPIRERWLAVVEADSYLFAYQPEWEGVNNSEWFRSVRDRKPDFQWWDFQAQFKLEYRYLIGARES